MFTADQIKTAHSKVKSGADFPAYIKAIKALGVKQYETHVKDGHVKYFGEGSYTISLPAKYETLKIAEQADRNQFKSGLLAHQHGKTDFLTFIKMCSVAGIERWKVSVENMTCAYFDKSGNEILRETIPQ